MYKNLAKNVQMGIQKWTSEKYFAKILKTYRIFYYFCKMKIDPFCGCGGFNCNLGGHMLQMGKKQFRGYQFFFL